MPSGKKRKKDTRCQLTRGKKRLRKNRHKKRSNIFFYSNNLFYCIRMLYYQIGGQVSYELVVNSSDDEVVTALLFMKIN